MTMTLNRKGFESLEFYRIINGELVICSELPKPIRHTWSCGNGSSTIIPYAAYIVEGQRVYEVHSITHQFGEIECYELELSEPRQVN